MTRPSASLGLASSLGMLFLAAAAVEALGLTWLARPALAGVEAAIGAILLAFASPPEESEPGHRWLEAAVWAAAALMLPAPWRWVAAAAAPAVLIGPSSRRAPAWVRRLASGVRCAAQVLVVNGLALSLALPVLLRGRGPEWMAEPLARILSALGLRATAWSEGIGIETLHGTPDLAAGWPLYAAPMAIAMLAASLVRIVQMRPARAVRLAIQITLATLAATLAGAVLAVLALAQVEIFVPIEAVEQPAALLHSPTWRAFLAGLLWVPLVARFTSDPAKSRAPVAATPSRSRRFLAPALAGIAALAAFALVVEEPGARKAGRVMIDEGHSEWEAVTPAYDTEWYGPDSGYNYAAIADFLSHHFAITVNTAPLTPARLSQTDVLILKTPTRAYSPEERAAVIRFVREGGGLFLVGEHTNVWGSGIYLNAIARPLGFEFEYDVVFDLHKRFEQIYTPPALAVHPATQGLDSFLFAVSCSVRPDALAVRPVMWQGGLWSLDIDYAVSNFYPQPRLGWRSRVGPHVQCVTRHVGRGRVAGFTDSTVWSNFSALLPGKPELLLGIIDWLDRSNRFPDPYPWATILAWLGAAAALVAVWRRVVLFGFTLALVLVGLAGGARLAGLANAAGYGPRVPDSSLVAVEFLENRADFEVGSWGFVTNVQRSYSIFFQWILRLGYFPRLCNASAPPLPGTKLAVTVMSSSDAPATEPWVRARLDRGIAVLVMLRPDTDPRRLAWLRDFGITVHSDTLAQHHGLVPRGGTARWPLRWLTSHRLLGGEDLLTADGGARVLVRGSAPLYVIAGAECFSDGWMGGDQGSAPDADLRRHFELAFCLVRGLIRGNAAEELAAGPTRPLGIRTSAAHQAGAVDRPGHRGEGEDGDSR